MLRLPLHRLTHRKKYYAQIVVSQIATVPVLVFYAIFQRKIIAGITTTGMAGQ